MLVVPQYPFFLSNKTPVFIQGLIHTPSKERAVSPNLRCCQVWPQAKFWPMRYEKQRYMGLLEGFLSRGGLFPPPKLSDKCRNDGGLRIPSGSHPTGREAKSSEDPGSLITTEHYTSPELPTFILVSSKTKSCLSHFGSKRRRRGFCCMQLNSILEVIFNRPYFTVTLQIKVQRHRKLYTY